MISNNLNRINAREREIERSNTMLRPQVSSLKEDGPISLKEEEQDDSPDKDTVKSITALTPMRTPLFNGIVLEAPIDTQKVTFGAKYPQDSATLTTNTAANSADAITVVKAAGGTTAVSAKEAAGESYLKFSSRKSSSRLT